MFNADTIILLIIYFISVSFCIYTILYVLKNYRKYGTNINALLIISTILITGCIYSTFYILSIIYYFNDFINVFYWKLTIVFGFLSIGILTIIYSFLKEYNKIEIFPLLLYCILFGLLIGNLFSDKSIQIIKLFNNSKQGLIQDNSSIIYVYSIPTGTLITLLSLFLICYLLYISIFIYFNARKKQVSKILILNTIIIITPLLMYNLYIYTQHYLFRDLHISLLCITFIGICLMLIKKPDIFLLMTNKIYSINIYHKSGVLLYSYKFGNTENLNDSAIWGNILIGINHILSEFTDETDQIDVFQTKHTDIIVKYNIEFGFAVLVITNQKNPILGNLVLNFIKAFKEKYKTELDEIQDLNKIINVSEFDGSKEMIEKYFKIFF